MTQLGAYDGDRHHRSDPSGQESRIGPRPQDRRDDRRIQRIDNKDGEALAIERSNLLCANGDVGF
jgi:hypothetical protein